MRGPHPLVSLLRSLGHEAAATGWSSATGSPFSCPGEMLTLPVTDTPLVRRPRPSEEPKAELRQAQARGNGCWSTVDRVSVVHSPMDRVHGFSHPKLITENPIFLFFSGKF
jgi:hypothetical protein